MYGVFGWGANRRACPAKGGRNAGVSPAAEAYPWQQHRGPAQRGCAGGMVPGQWGAHRRRCKNYGR